MEQEARYFLVGSVMLLLTAGLVGMMLWFSRATAGGEFSSHAIYFREQSLSGLQIGSDVTMRGIPVGKVKKIRILPEEAGVRVVVEIDSSAPIGGATQAVVERNMLTGFASIELKKSEEKVELYQAPVEDEYLPVIREGRGQLAELAVSMTEIARTAGEVLQKLNAALSEENLRIFASALENIDHLAGSMAKEEGNISKLIGSLSGAAMELRNAITVTSQGVSEMQQAWKGTAQALSIESGNVARSIERAANRIALTAERYENPRSVILGPSGESLGPGERRQR